MQNNNIPKNPRSYKDDYTINPEFKLLINADICNEKVHILLVEGKEDETLLYHIMNDSINIIVCSDSFKEVIRLL